MTRLDALVSQPQVDSEIKRAIRIDASENIRNMATLGGWLVSSDGRSAFTTLMLALDTSLFWEPNSTQVRMGDWLRYGKLSRRDYFSQQRNGGLVPKWFSNLLPGHQRTGQH